MHRMSIFFAVAAALAVIGCGSSDDLTDDPFARVKESLAKSAYLPSYQSCVIGKAEGLLPPEELQDLAELPREEGLKAISKVLVPAELKCKQGSGGRIVAPDANPQELARTRDIRAEGVARGIILSGEGNALAQCVEREMKSMSNAQVVEFENAGFNAQAQQIARLAKPCFGE